NDNFSEEKIVMIDVDIENEKIINSLLKDNHSVRMVNLNGQKKVILPLSAVYKLPVDEIKVLRRNSFSTIKMIGILFILIVVIKFILQFFQMILTNIASQKAMHDLRSDLFSHLERMPTSFFDKNPVGRLVTRVTNDIRSIDEMIANGAINIIQDFFIVVAIMVIMLVLNWKLALVSFAVLPLVIFTMVIFKKKTRNSYRQMRKFLAQVNATLAEHISGVKIIQLFSQHKHKSDQFEKSNMNYFTASMKQLKLFAIFRPLIGVSRHVATAIILWYAGGQILQNFITIGLFMAFISYMEKLYEPINHFSEKFNILQAAMAGAERIFDLKDKVQEDYYENMPPISKINSILIPEKQSKPLIEFKNVWLSYQENPAENSFVLKNICLKIKPGEKIALVGHTGSGKTSIVNLLLNMYPYQKGEILVDDKNINEYRLKDLRNNIGMVQQDVFLFSGTIKDNIVLNNHNISDAEVNRITDYVNVSKFINSLPGKLYEEVQERGATLSVGQRQLIAFARVLAYDPEIFILDEATSNIDTETEILIQDALFKIMQNRTSIIIAHRLSTIQHVDRIIVLHKGEIVEEGSHQELLQKDGVNQPEGLYYNLYRLQYT
ncbi:MAG: ABC transporter ATP-binding protein, partial [Candidatus Cloacimonetes bacterium]|nr:ABC transporter ATP-binding protein [Candidatus Cloacimonadota bacterium]